MSESRRRVVTDEMVDVGARAAFTEPISDFRRGDMRAALEAVLSTDPLHAALVAEVEVRREEAARLRDLAQRCATAAAAEELLAKATKRDQDTDRLQAILDAC